jgi:hypothetical protein
MTDTITIPPPQSIREQIELRRAELRELQRLLKLASCADRVRDYAERRKQNDSQAMEAARAR